MDYREFRPPEHLAHLIECIWTNTLHPGDFKQEYDLIIPDGSAEIIFMLKGKYLRKDEANNTSCLIESASLVAPFNNAIKVYQQPGTACLALRLKPGALQQLTDVCLGELGKAAYPLEELMPELADMALEEVEQNSSLEHLVQKVIGFIRDKKMERVQNFIHARFIEKTLRLKGNISINEFCISHQIHKSTLEKNFKNDSGLTPKQFSGLIRFNYLLQKLMQSNATLAEISYDLGYYDQSHMTREFKKIVGLPPAAFLKKDFTVPKLAVYGIMSRDSRYRL